MLPISARAKRRAAHKCNGRQDQEKEEGKAEAAGQSRRLGSQIICGDQAWKVGDDPRLAHKHFVSMHARAGHPRRGSSPPWALSLNTNDVDWQMLGVRAPVSASGGVPMWIALVSKPVN